MKRVRLVTLGEMAPTSWNAYHENFPSLTVTELKHPTPSGLRLGSRALGLGIDSLAVAAKARLGATAPATLVTNPWPAVACKTLGLPNVAVIGIYASPGSRSWRALRSGLGFAPVVTTSSVEARAWCTEGGRAVAVLWGGTFRVPLSTPSRGQPQIFVGGTSDRDEKLLRRLFDEVRLDRRIVRVVVANGSGPREWRGKRSSISWLPYTSSSGFASEMASCNVNFLPLSESGRSAGHMVLVESMQAGLPSLIQETTATQGYSGFGVNIVDDRQSLLDQLLDLAGAGVDHRQALHSRWREEFSVDSYVSRTLKALSSMGWPGELTG